MNDLVALYCAVDDFWKEFKSEWNKYLIGPQKTHGPEPVLSTPEMMTIIILFHQ